MGLLICINSSLDHVDRYYRNMPIVARADAYRTFDRNADKPWPLPSSLSVLIC